jgi:hypothetical protein
LPIQIPCTNKAADIIKLLGKLAKGGLPDTKVDADFIKKMGFSAVSATSLVEILKKLGFVDESEQASAIWAGYASSDDRDRILAAAIKTAYSGLFKEMMCPYLGDDESLLEFIKANVKASPREMEYCLETFRALCELADFQDSLNDYDYVEPMGPVKIPETEMLPQVKVDPNMQINIQIHIDPNTPDAKIETIFKYMRRYLLGKE